MAENDLPAATETARPETQLRERIRFLDRVIQEHHRASHHRASLVTWDGACPVCVEHGAIEMFSENARLYRSSLGAAAGSEAPELAMLDALILDDNDLGEVIFSSSRVEGVRVVSLHLGHNPLAVGIGDSARDAIRHASRQTSVRATPAENEP